MRSLVLVAALALASCSNTTGGALIALPFSVGGVDRPGSGPLTFTSSLGWTVTLDEGRVALGPFYFNVTAVQTGAVEGGLVIVQVTAQTMVDVLDPTMHAVPAGADGQTGEALTVAIGLLPPDETQSVVDVQLLGTGVAYIRGTAVQGAVSVPFAGVVAINLSLATPQNPPALLERVNGANVDLTFAASGQQLLLHVDPSTWFNTANFAPLLLGTPDSNGNYGWSIDSSFNAAVLTGIKQTSGVYDFQLQTM